MYTIAQVSTVIGESPIWNSNSSTLVWVEAAGKEVFKYNFVSETLNRFPLPFEVTAVAPCDNHHWVFASKQGLFYSTPRFEHFTLISDPCSNDARLHLNDAVAAPNGDLWFGSMNCEQLESADGELFRLSKQQIGAIDQGFSVANGIAFNPQLKRAYCSNMFQRKVYEYQLDESMSHILDKEVLVEFEPQQGFPDGLSVDQAGNVYICHWDCGIVSYYQPNHKHLGHGRKLGQIELPVKHATRCTFGGKNYQTLFITTASYDLSPSELETYPQSGELFVVQAPTKGRAEYLVDARSILSKVQASASLTS